MDRSPFGCRDGTPIFRPSNGSPNISGFNDTSIILANGQAERDSVAGIPEIVASFMPMCANRMDQGCHS
jgi:hypothetical protein